MKSILISIGCALPILLAMASCGKEEPKIAPAAGDAILIIAGVGNFLSDGGTRAIIDDATGKGSFEAGDQISLWVRQEFITTISGTKTLTYDGSRWRGFAANWHEYEDDMEFGTRLKFIACYPNIDTSQSEINCEVKSDQSIDGNYEKSDFLGAMQELAAKPPEGVVQLDFEHLLARIKITLQGSKADKASLLVRNVETNYRVNDNLSIDKIPTGNYNIIPKRIGNDFYAVIPPQQLESVGLQLAVIINGETIEFEVGKGMENKMLEGGRQYEIVLNLK